MQVNSPSTIYIIFNNTKINNFGLRIYNKVELDYIKYCSEIFQYKPTKFIWKGSHLRPITPKLIKWIQTEFKPLFEYDPLLWAASVGTCCPELIPYLINFNDRTIPKELYVI